MYVKIQWKFMALENKKPKYVGGGGGGFFFFFFFFSLPRKQRIYHII
jgi:hypothetical protein